MVNSGQRYFTEGAWHFDLVAKNIWKIYYSGASKIAYIAMTGSDVTTELHIPFSHRWNSTHFYHASSANADSHDTLTITIRRPKTKNTPRLFEEEMVVIKTTATKKSDTWGEKFEREESTYNIILNTTSTDLVYPVFYVQQLGA